MRRNVLICTSMMLLATAGNLFAVEVDIDGASPGKWTMDFDAAKKVAAEKHLPILLDFSGSDWCGWCQLMETNVFTKPDWQAYATNSLMMVLIDFPQNKSLVPEKYVERNTTLSEKYGVEGFPTYVVLDDDGETVLGQLGAGQDKTAQSFESELQTLFRFRPAEIAKYADTLDAEKKAAYLALVDQLAKTKEALTQQQQRIADAHAKLAELQESVGKTEEDIRMFHIAQLGEAKVAEYKDLKAKLEAATRKLEDWIGTNPERSDENMKLYQEMSSEIQSLQEQLSKF